MPARLIDTRHLGVDRVIGVWQRDRCLIDPGPSSSIEQVLEGLRQPPEAVLLTHVHLDHAGATGTLVERFPDLRVFVHELGAPHLIDPERLLSSAERLYGDQMQRLWGPVLPVPATNVTTLAGGETVEGFEVVYTPGHAAHHVSFLDQRSGEAFVGDVGGVRIPRSKRLLMPTPPPDIDIEAWDRSLGELAKRRPKRLLLTHFGAIEQPAEHIERARSELRTLAASARELGRDAFLARLGRVVSREPDDVSERLRLAMPLEQTWLGLERYWRKRES